MNDSQGPKFFGKYRGVVRSNLDPTFRGRLQVQVPQVLGDEQVWAMPCVPYAGPSKGLYALPDSDTGVWVEFEAGDPSYPIWTGCFWALGDVPAADALPNVKFFKTDKFTLRIDDLLGEIRIDNGAGAEIVLSAFELSMKGASVVAQAAGGRKTQLSAISFNVNSGGLEVL